jgi:hypothetical protein
MKRLSLSLPLWFVPVLLAQQPGAAPVSDHELIQQLLRRVSELEAEVQSLRLAPGAAAAATPQTAGAAPQTAPMAPPASQPPSVDQTMRDMQLPGGLPGLHIQGFSDIQYRASSEPLDHNTFLLGQFNLFISSRLTEKTHVLAEVVAEADEHNSVGIDLERLLFQYSANDYFNLSAGRYHTAIGFYNTAYHHATWLQTTVDRPFLYAFEDDGGILPIHNVGLSASGRIPSGHVGLHYVAEMGNGRASRSPLDEPVQNLQDENNRKAFNLALFARPDSVRGFQAGFSVYRDRLYPQGLRPIGQTIYSAHAIYQPSHFEFMNEVVVLRHALDSGAVFHIPAFYTQVSKQFGKVRPYFRYEYINVPTREPLFADVGLLHGPLAGVRYDFNDFAAYKLEFGRSMRRQLEPFNTLRTQVTFTF